MIEEMVRWLCSGDGNGLNCWVRLDMGSGLCCVFGCALVMLERKDGREPEMVLVQLVVKISNEQCSVWGKNK